MASTFNQGIELSNIANYQQVEIRQVLLLLLLSIYILILIIIIINRRNHRKLSLITLIIAWYFL